MVPKLTPEDLKIMNEEDIKLLKEWREEQIMHRCMIAFVIVMIILGKVFNLELGT